SLIALFLDGSDDRLALAERARSNVDIAQQDIVLRTFMCRHVSHTASADNQNIAFHWITPQFLSEQCCRSGQTVDVIVKGKFAHDAHGAIGLLNGYRRHVDAVEPILFHHGVAGSITNGNAVAYLQGTLEAAFAENVASEAGFAADHVFVLPLTIPQRSSFTVNEQVQHVC